MGMSSGIQRTSPDLYSTQEDEASRMSEDSEKKGVLQAYQMRVCLKTWEGLEDKDCVASFKRQLV